MFKVIKTNTNKAINAVANINATTQRGVLIGAGSGD